MNLLFDLDGTISDPFEGITKSINYALIKMGSEEKELAQLSKFIGPSLKIAFGELLSTDSEETLLKAISYYRERYFSVGFKENRLYPGIVSLLDRNKSAGHRQWIVTSKREDIATRVIEHFNLAEYFDGVYGCDIHLSKGELIEKVINQEELNPNETLMIGDRKFDIEAGIQNSLKTIGVLWGYGSIDELEEASANQIMHSVDELNAKYNRLA